jgi:hypothetical protein
MSGNGPDLTYNVKAQYWMAEAVYRYYWKKEVPAFVRGLTVCFFDFGNRIEEPILLAAEMRYLFGESQDKPLCEGWDIWNLHFERLPGPEIGKVLKRTTETGRIQSANVLATPLYEIKSIEDVELKMRQVKDIP